MNLSVQHLEYIETVKINSPILSGNPTDASRQLVYLTLQGKEPRIQGVPDEFLILDPFNSEHNEKTLFNKGCVTMGSTPCYEVAEWFHKVLKPLLHGL